MFCHHLVALRKKIILACHTVEATHGLGMGCWCLNTMHSHLVSSLLNSLVLCASLVSQCSHSPHQQYLEQCLAHSHWMPGGLGLGLRSGIHSLAGCLRVQVGAPMDHLPVLSGIQPAELCRLGATLSLAHRESLDPNHILYGLLSGSSDSCHVRLRSRCLFVPAARNLLNNLSRLGIRAFEQTNHK